MLGILAAIIIIGCGFKVFGLFLGLFGRLLGGCFRMFGVIMAFALIGMVICALIKAAAFILPIVLIIVLISAVLGSAQ